MQSKAGAGSDASDMSCLTGPAKTDGKGRAMWQRNDLRATQLLTGKEVRVPVRRGGQRLRRANRWNVYRCCL